MCFRRPRFDYLFRVDPSDGGPRAHTHTQRVFSWVQTRRVTAVRNVFFSRVNLYRLPVVNRRRRRRPIVAPWSIVSRAVRGTLYRPGLLSLALRRVADPLQFAGRPTHSTSDVFFFGWPKISGRYITTGYRVRCATTAYRCRIRCDTGGGF